MQTKHLRLITLVALVGLVLVWSQSGYAKRFHKGSDEMQLLHEQIGAHLLFRALELQPDQKPKLLGALNAIRDTLAQIDAHREQIHAAHKVVMEEALAQLQQGKDIDFEALAFNPETQGELRQAMFELRGKLRGEFERVIALLTPEQQERLRGFHPMAFLGGGPPRDFGCSGDAASLLDKIRFAPPYFVEHLDRRVQGSTERWAARGKSDKTQAMKEFWATLLEVRKLDEDAYRRNRDSLAER